MTDPRPVPRYGEYAQVPAAPPPEAPAAPPARPRRTWDLVLATGLNDPAFAAHLAEMTGR